MPLSRFFGSTIVINSTLVHFTFLITFHLMNVSFVGWIRKRQPFNQMKQILKIISLLVALSAVWIGLLSTSVVPQSYALLVGFNYYSWIMLLGGLWMMLTFTIALFQLPIYLVVALGCYGLLMVGVGLMRFPTCPQEAVLLQKVLSDPFCTSMSSPKNWLLSMICFAFYFVELYSQIPLHYHRIKDSFVIFFLVF